MKIAKKYWVFIVLLSLVSTGVGWFWGSGAQILYISGGEIPLFGNGIENPNWLGGLLGVILGLIVGILYAFRLVTHVEDGYGLGKAVTSGILAGVICSSLVHIGLMIFYINSHLGPLFIGALFGIFSGAVLGLVGGGIFIACYNRKQNLN